MKRLIILAMVVLYGMVPGPANRVMAQGLMDRPEPFPTILRVDGLGDQSPSPDPGPLSPRAKPYFKNIDSEPKVGSKTPESSVRSKLTTLMSFITVRTPDKLSIVPDGVRIGSGFTYSFAFSSRLSAFTTFNPTLGNMSSDPQSMLSAFTTGIQVPILKRSGGSNDLSLRFSTAVDHQFRPTFFFSLATPFNIFNSTQEQGAFSGQYSPPGASRGAF